MKKLRREGNGEWWRYERGSLDFAHFPDEGTCEVCKRVDAAWISKFDNSLYCEACLQHPKKAIWLEDGSEELQRAKSLYHEPQFAQYVAPPRKSSKAMDKRQQVFDIFDIHGMEGEGIKKALEVLPDINRLRKLCEEYNTLKKGGDPNA